MAEPSFARFVNEVMSGHHVDAMATWAQIGGNGTADAQVFVLLALAAEVAKLDANLNRGA